MGSDRRGTDAVFRLGPNTFFRSSIGILNVNIVYKVQVYNVGNNTATCYTG